MYQPLSLGIAVHHTITHDVRGLDGHYERTRSRPVQGDTMPPSGYTKKDTIHGFLDYVGLRVPFFSEKLPKVRLKMIIGSRMDGNLFRAIFNCPN